MNGSHWIKGTVKGAVAAGAALAMGGWAAPQAKATPAGLTFYPSTDIYGKNVFHFDADLFAGTNFNRTTLTSEGIEYGIGPDREGALGRSEIGFDYVSSIGQVRSRNRLLVNAKTQLFSNDASGTRLVAGVWGVGSRGNLNSGDTVFPPDVGYLLGSKSFKFGRVHLGVAHSFAKRDVITTPGGGDDRTYLQLGYDKVFAGGKLQFTTDFYSGKSAASVFAPGIIYYLNDKSDFQLGYIRFNDKSITPRNQLYVGFDYNFGKGAETPAPAPAPEDNTKQPATGGGAPDRPNP